VSNRGLPHDWHIEQVLLGTILACGDVSAVVDVVKPDDFHKPTHALLFGHILACAAEGDPPTPARLLRRIEAAGALESLAAVSHMGPTHYVLSLSSHGDIPENIGGLVRDLLRDSRRRAAVLELRALEERLLSDVSVDPAVGLMEMQARLEASQPPAKGEGWVPQADVVRERLEDIRHRTANPGQITGIPTGIDALDRLIGGFQRTRFYVIAGRPAMGKSAVMQCFAEHGAKFGDVGIITLEMPKEEIGERALVKEARVNSTRVRDGAIDEHDWRRLCDAEESLSARNVWIDDASAASISQIVNKIRKLKERRPNLHTVYLDYLQLATAEGKKNGSRQQEIGQITRGCKTIAKQVDIAVVALAQLSRQCEARVDKRPVPSDLRESGDIEQDADAIIFVYRDEVYVKESPKKGTMEIIVGKQRKGATGTIECAWIGAEYRIANIDRHVEPDYPRSYEQ